MTIVKHWEKIQAVFVEGNRSSMHFAIATVDNKGFPHVTPIGALFLGNKGTGFCFDEMTSKMSENLNKNSNVAILAINSDPVFWEKSLISGKFIAPPGVRLSGTMGKKREATQDEINMWKNEIKPFEGTKGYNILWKDLKTVRDIKFNSFEPVLCRDMTEGLWD